MKAHNLTGQRFGRATVVARIEGPTKNDLWWNCLCDCGTVWMVRASSLATGNTKSCGCYRTEIKSTAKKHGYARRNDTRSEYKIWASMKDRCHNPENRAYKNYGARGITVCDEWRNDFAQFIADMGPRPPGLSIERKDNDGPYAPWNCLWATWKEQCRNQRTNVRINSKYGHITVAEAVERSGLGRSVINRAIKQNLTLDECPIASPDDWMVTT